MSLAEATDLLRAVGGLLWPVIIAVLVWKLFPQLKEILERDITFERGRNKMTFSNAAKEFAKNIDDLQGHVSQLMATRDVADPEQEPDAAAGESPLPEPSAAPRRILWVDDHPENDAFLIESLRDERVGAVVVEAPSTSRALTLLAEDPGFDLVVTDMAREEDGTARDDAGIALIQAMRRGRLRVPVIVYASARALQAFGRAAVAAGAAAATASPTELRALLRLRPGSRFEAAVEEKLRAAGVPYRPVVVRRTVDLVVERDDRRTGIEIKNMRERPSTDRVERLIAELERARAAFELDDVAVVVHESVRLPLDPPPPPWVRVVTIDELVASLR